jgi:hypothetical protein
MATQAPVLQIGGRERGELGWQMEGPPWLDECVAQMADLDHVAMPQSDLGVRLAIDAHAVARLGVHHLPGALVEMEAQVLAGDRGMLDAQVVFLRAPHPDGASVEQQLLAAVLAGDADQLRALPRWHFLDRNIELRRAQIGEADGGGLRHAARLRLCVFNGRGKRIAAQRVINGRGTRIAAPRLIVSPAR